MLKFYKFIFSYALILLVSSEIYAQALFDDFNSATLNTADWTVANQVWGNTPGRRTNGGVVPQNVRISNGNLVIEAHGNQYNGPVAGHGQNTRVGGAIYTKRQFASGRYEVRAKVLPHPGALSAFWTYYYENDNYNHEIDFEMPGRNQEPNSPATSSMDWGLCTSWRGVGSGQYKTHDKFFGNQIDGNYHLYRFEWHTGGNGQAARIEWYYDNVLVATNTDPAVIPNHISNYWIGVWFPWWVAEPNFNTLYMFVDWVRITPFNEPNDFPTPVCSTAPNMPGLIVGNTTVAAGSTQTYYVDNVPGATSYVWTLPSGWTGTSTTNAITTRVGSTGGAISIRSRNSCGTSAARSINLTVGSTTGIVSGQTYSFINVHSNKAMEVGGFSTVNGGNVQQWDYVGVASQKWRVTDVGGGAFNLINIHSRKCLDVSGVSSADGANIHQWDYVGGGNQKWQIIANGDGTYRIISVHSGKAVQVGGLSTANGGNLQQWVYVGGNQQKWRFTQVAARVSNPEAASSETELQLYPNPVTNSLFINSIDDFTGAKFNIISAQGKEILKGVCSQNGIDLSILKPGIYSISINANGKKITKTFIKD